MVVDRGMALHKMIRLVTIATGGEGYLNFMGNEFGHPEWIDFPREGNGWSFAHARRLWSLAENGYLRYELLGNFDKAMIAMIKKYDVLEGGMPRCLRQHEDDQILAFEKKGCVFVFNFHPTRSQTGLFVPVPENGDYQVVLSTDDKVFGGYQNIDKTVIYHTWAHDPQMGDGFVIYLPARTAVVLRKVEKKKDLTNTARRGKLSITRSLLGLVGEAAFIEAMESGEQMGEQRRYRRPQQHKRTAAARFPFRKRNQGTAVPHSRFTGDGQAVWPTAQAKSKAARSCAEFGEKYARRGL